MKKPPDGGRLIIDLQLTSFVFGVNLNKEEI